MSESVALSLFDSLGQVPDPRLERTRLHQLVDILVIAVCATICAAETWEEVAEFGRAKESWFKKFLALPNGIPSHDTFRRVFLRINPRKFQEAFLCWVRAAARMSAGEVIAIDGKPARGARTADGKEGLRMVSAWATEQRLVLGQLKTEEKSNEITAIPLLLELLELKGCIVTIDAMGCQRAVAAQVISQEADYVLSLKGNQGRLHEEVEEYFAWAEGINFKDLKYDYCATLEKDHGRIEGRRCWVTEDIAWFTEQAQWAGLRSFIMVEAEREVVGHAASVERRYFISSLPADATQALRAVRGHWQVENSLHWVLDVAFHEDACRTRTGHAPENLATLRHIAINLLKQERSCKLGVKSKRLKAGWDESYMLKVLNI
ncbi:MAG: ISAs1 family transposase [Acidobacteria bacterium]|nr:ISAs1 family transposase [Acidobacteriota bacterium]